MKVAILALTCGRPEKTRKTWEHNLPIPKTELYWWDNSGPDDEDAIRDICSAFKPTRWYKVPTNTGISGPFNIMMREAFEDGADIVVTMANDILEQEGWVTHIVQAAKEIEDVGLICTPPAGPGTVRYPRKSTFSGLRYEEGDVIGNTAILRRTFDAVGGFYDGYGVYGPIDLDYCARVRAAGLRTVYLSEWESQHLPGPNPTEYQTAKDQSLKASWALFKNRMSNIKKHIYHDPR